MARKRPAGYRMNSFFSGIGGFELAFERHGFTAGFMCEKDDFCHRVLEHHWPKVAKARDINELTGDDVPEAPVWTAGFPCQDLSLAKVPHGRTGFRGDHSSLFFKFHELLSEHTPRVVILENVAGLLNSHGGADFTLLLKSLNDLGYAVAWRVLNARYFGVPQSRPRVFICAWLGDPSRAVGSLFEAKKAPVLRGERAGFMTPFTCEATGAVVPRISYCISATSGRHTGLDWARSYVTLDGKVRRPTPLECERLQGFPDEWTRLIMQGVTPIDGNDTERYAAVGNAVAIPVVEWIASRVKTRLDRLATREQIDAFDASARSADLTAYAEEFRDPRATEILLKDVQKLAWKRSGIAFDGRVIHAHASTASIHTVESRFVDILEKQSVHRRYFLSPNAAAGILRRVERRGRHLFAPLAASLRQLAGEAIAKRAGKKTRAHVR